MHIHKQVISNKTRPDVQLSTPTTLTCANTSLTICFNRSEANKGGEHKKEFIWWTDNIFFEWKFIVLEFCATRVDEIETEKIPWVNKLLFVLFYLTKHALNYLLLLVIKYNEEWIEMKKKQFPISMYIHIFCVQRSLLTRALNNRR